MLRFFLCNFCASVVKLFVLLLLVCSVTGCRSGPRAQSIDLPSCAIQTAIEDVDDDAVFETSEYTEWLPETWWMMFNDPQLCALIDTALVKNPTLQAAEANIFAAVAQAEKMRANLCPTVTWSADVSREKLSETGLIPFKTQETSIGVPPPVAPTNLGVPVYFTQYETSAMLTYDFDLWKKNRNTLYAALGQVQASLADRAFSELQLAIAVCRNYFNLQTNYQRLDIANALVANKQEYLKLTQQRVEYHIDNLQSVYNAEDNLSIAQHHLMEIKNNVAINEHQLQAYLANDFEDTFENIEIHSQPLPTVPLPKDLPLHLLAHRPDIISQLWLIESAGRRIEVAKAGFYPDLNITALIGYQTIKLHELFNHKSLEYNVDPAISLPIFDGGYLKANLRNTEVNYDLAIFEYNQRILNAVQEVLDGISILHNTYQQLQEQKKQTAYQDNLYKLSQQLVANNLASKLDDLTSESEKLMALDHETAALNNTLQAILSLVKAIGGGYTQ